MIDLKEMKAWITHPDTVRYVPSSAVQRVQDLVREVEAQRRGECICTKCGKRQDSEEITTADW